MLGTIFPHLASTHRLRIVHGGTEDITHDSAPMCNEQLLLWQSELLEVCHRPPPLLSVGARFLPAHRRQEAQLILQARGAP